MAAMAVEKRRVMLCEDSQELDALSCSPCCAISAISERAMLTLLPVATSPLPSLKTFLNSIMFSRCSCLWSGEEDTASKKVRRSARISSSFLYRNVFIFALIFSQAVLFSLRIFSSCNVIRENLELAMNGVTPNGASYRAM